MPSYPQGRLLGLGSSKQTHMSYSYLSNWKNYTWYNNVSYCGTPGKADAEEKATSEGGVNCAARIMDNGWVMDY